MSRDFTMKPLLVITLVLISLSFTTPSYSSSLLCGTVGIGCKSATWDDLIYRNDTFFTKFSDTPFSGQIEGERSGKIIDGKQEGLWKYFRKSGQLESKGEYQNGKRTGLWMFFHPNGDISEQGKFQNDKPEGEWVRYWDNRQLWVKQYFRYGLNDGPFISYHKENGQKHWQGNFRDGKKDGRWFVYREDGTVWDEKTGTYKNDVKVGD